MGNEHIVLLELKHDSIKLKNNSDVCLKSYDQEFNKTLEKYKVKEFFKVSQNPNSKYFNNLYEIHINGDLDTFRQDLKSSHLFEFKRELEIYEALSCDNPEPDVNDYYVAQGWVNNYALEIIDANCAWSVTKGSSSIVVGIADTEFKTHEDLQNQFVSITGPITDCFPHGLYVAGCCSPETNNNLGIAGIGYNTKLAGYRVAHQIYVDPITKSRTATGSPYSAIISAFNDGRKIINVSWSGTGLSESEATTIVSAGTVLVLAAGNSVDATNHSSIADIPGVINVSNVDADNMAGTTTCARNQWVDLCSPGYNATTVEDPDSLHHYKGVWGTSASAPYVSGTIALMMSVNKCLSPAIIEDVLKETCDALADGYLYPNLVGAGKLNAYNAVLGAIEEGTVHRDGLTLTGTNTYPVALYLSSSNTTISNGAHITFQAENSITLGSEFTVELGGEFTTNFSTYTCP
jgi:subtilisin family serine protease